MQPIPGSIFLEEGEWFVQIDRGRRLAPGETLPTYVLALDVKSPEKFSARLRRQSPAVIARTENDTILLDPRTVLPEQEKQLLRILKSLLLEFE